MKSQIKQVTPVETFKPITLEIQIESLEELKILRGLYGANKSVAKAVIANADYMGGVYEETASRLMVTTFEPLEQHYERHHA